MITNTKKYRKKYKIIINGIWSVEQLNHWTNLKQQHPKQIEAKPKHIWRKMWIKQPKNENENVTTEPIANEITILLTFAHLAYTMGYDNA